MQEEKRKHCLPVHGMTENSMCDGHCSRPGPTAVFFNRFVAGPVNEKKLQKAAEAGVLVKCLICLWVVIL